MVPVTKNSSKLLKLNVFSGLPHKQGHPELSRENNDSCKYPTLKM
jgi:hypothetical protein